MWSTITHDHDRQNQEKKYLQSLMIVIWLEMIGDHDPISPTLRCSHCWLAQAKQHFCEWATLLKTWLQCFSDKFQNIKFQYLESGRELQSFQWKPLQNIIIATDIKVWTWISLDPGWSRKFFIFSKNFPYDCARNSFKQEGE